jgi:hypothetical protein
MAVQRTQKLAVQSTEEVDSTKRVDKYQHKVRREVSRNSACFSAGINKYVKTKKKKNKKHSLYRPDNQKLQLKYTFA